MQERELICATIGVANHTDISGRKTAQKIDRGSRTEKGNFRRIARWTIVLNAFAAFNVGLLSVAVCSAKASDALPLVQIPQDEAPHHDATEWE
jgi:hypothetical protein